MGQEWARAVKEQESVAREEEEKQREAREAIVALVEPLRATRDWVRDNGPIWHCFTFGGIGSQGSRFYTNGRLYGPASESAPDSAPASTQVTVAYEELQSNYHSWLDRETGIYHPGFAEAHQRNLVRIDTMNLFVLLQPTMPVELLWIIHDYTLTDPYEMWVRMGLGGN